jgi:RimJ/RimL family protein N-acetyltransferase
MTRLIETERLYLRELTGSDASDLACILSDPESMKYYPKPFTPEQVRNWIQWNIDNYQKYRHGLWAVILKDGDIFLGDCGITIQEIEGEYLPELGYHIKKEFWCKGYATEAAKACLDYAFSTFKYNELFSYTNQENIPSIKVMKKIGMQFRRGFKKWVMGVEVNEVLYSIRLNCKKF